LPASTGLRLLFQDEARFGCISDHRRCWAPLPVRPVVGQQIIRQFVYGLAAVSPLDGQLSCLVLPWLDTDTMSLFLEHTATRFSQQHCLLLFDGAGWHTAGALRVPSNISLVRLPSYSPELNPTEHIWDHLRENYIGNRVFPSLDGVIRQLCRGLHDLHFDAKLVRSLTCFNWIKTLSLTLK
jgi:transposase